MVNDVMKKIEILEREGYSYDWSREIYYNIQTKRVFSREMMESKDLTWLQKKIGWKFHFLTKPSQEASDTLVKVLEKRG